MADIYDAETNEVRVMRDMCSTCIFRSGNRMDLAPGRLKEMIQETKKDDFGHIPCHHTLPYSFPPQDKAAVCRGWWDLLASTKMWARLAASLGLIKLWDEPKEASSG